ncbi:MAG: hypothetical protein PVI21_01515 [Candidatus Woesebacteria bacterium]
MNEQEYNGWSNYETWLMALWLRGDQGSYELLEEIKAGSDSAYSKAERLEELAREMYRLETDGIAGDLINTSLARVNWVEIVTEE